MVDARLELNDGLGLRVIPLDKPQITIGRRGENDVRLTGSDVSRDHAEIVATKGDYVLKDKGSRYGTFVNDSQVTEHKLVSGDRLQFGRAAGTDIVFRIGANAPSSERTPVTAVSDLRQLAALLEGLALSLDERIEHDRRKRHRSPDSEQRAHLVLNQFDTGELEGPHQVAAEEEEPGSHESPLESA